MEVKRELSIVLALLDAGLTGFVDSKNFDYLDSRLLRPGRISRQCEGKFSLVPTHKPDSVLLPDTSWDSIGGYENVKSLLKEMVSWPRDVRFTLLSRLIF